MTILIGQIVWIKSSAKRYNAGYGKVIDINSDDSRSQKYLIERTESAGKGLRKFWAARGEFELTAPIQS